MANNNRNVDWDYEKLGPEVWYKKFPNCASKSQSPVNIKTKCTIPQTFEPFQFTSLYNQTVSFTLKNDGHTITAKSNGSKFPLNGGNLHGNYQFANFHLHWGPNENVGSEHQINGGKYTGESHFVYENLETGTMAVLGFFMKSESTEDNKDNYIHNSHRYVSMTQWQKYFDATQHLIKENDTITVDLNLSLLMGENLNDFWRYNGSLTVPPCTEGVIWTIFKEPIYIYDYEFVSFRDDLFYESYRGPQSLYHRKIYRSFKDEILSPIPDQNCCIDNSSKGNSFILYSVVNYLFLILLINFNFSIL